VTPWTISARLEQPSAFSLSLSLSGADGIAHSVRNPSAVVSSAAYQSQRRQPSDQQILKAANGVNGNKRPSGLVRIE
jgi:hypothetical protein